MKIRFLFLVGLLLSLLIACINEEITPTAEPQPTAAPPTATRTPEPTATAIPTNTPEATATATATPLPTATPNPLRVGTNNMPWWNDVVFYEIFVRSFYDSDGNGIGDLNGVIEKLDYLNDGDPDTTNDLGVTGIWLMPIMVSPSYHGYDVVDYYQIDPDYGTNKDFKRLMDEAHKRGIVVIVDLVMNHTSTQHPWFKASKNDEGGKREWYRWDDDPAVQKVRGPWGQQVWHRDPSGFYYGVFWDQMPDLNFENPEVTAAMYDAAKFWMVDMGVDGFRLDAIKHMIEDGSIQENSLPTHAWMEEFYTFYKEVDPTFFTVGEAWTSTAQVIDYTGDEVDIAFQFDLALDILNGANSGLAPAFYKTQQLVYDSFPQNQYATFITNHDQNRVIDQLQGDEDKARMAASILLTAPGVPFVYYGEEIGMTGTKPDEDIRLPMQWNSNSPKVGFSTNDALWRPAAADWPVKSVARQENDPDSLLNHYKNLIHLRNNHEALRVGDWTLVDSGSPRIYAFLRHTENETVLVIMNLNVKQTVTADKYSLNLDVGPLSEGVIAEALFGQEPNGQLEVNAAGGFADYRPFAEMPPQTTNIIHFR